MTFMEVVEWMFEANEEELAAVAAVLEARHSREDEPSRAETLRDLAQVVGSPHENEEAVEVDASPPPSYRPEYGKKSEAKFKGETNAERHITRQRRASARRAKLETNAPFAYEPEAPWAKKMWRRLQRTAKAQGVHKHLSVEQLAKEVGAQPKLVGMALYTLYQKPNTPVVRIKRGASYFYGVER